MMSNDLSPEFARVIDANLNRLREGIRVVEDILRYLYNNKELSLKLKNLRHKTIIKESFELIKQRDSINDVLKSSTQSELSRDNLCSIVIANFKRAEESSRVLEEILKVNNTQYSQNFKSIRYELYIIERIVFDGIIKC